MNKFHTILVNPEGKIFHLNTNDVNEMIKESGWDNYIIAQWNGTPPIPNFNMSNWNKAQKQAVINHYYELSEFLQCAEYYKLFSTQKYLDVREYAAIKSDNDVLLA